MTRNRALVAASIVSIGLAVAGIATVLVAVSTPPAAASFGWFAYAPLSGSSTFGGDGFFVQSAALVGAMVMAVGLIGVAFLAGFGLGRRPH